jgi:hypothetical protein
MTVTTPAYCSRTDVQRAMDIKDTVLNITRVDEAIQGTARDIEANLHRLFYPWDGTKWFDWPNYQYAYPWRQWMDRNDILCLSALSSGSVSIALNQCFLRPTNRLPGFPYTSIELDRSTSAAFGGTAQTPQNSIMAEATWGFTADAAQAGTATLAGSLTTSTNPVVVTDSSQISAGDLLIIGYSRGTPPFPDDTLGHAGLIAPYQGERILVQDVSFADTGQQQTGGGCTAASSADNQLTVGDGADLNAGETLLLDAERMFVEQVNGNIATVVRAWDGTLLATHSGAEVYALRSLTVERGALGTTAQVWDEDTAVYKHRYPSPVRELGIALSLDTVLQQTSGYARTVPAGDTSVPAPGIGLAAAWGRAATYAARKARTRVI